MNGPIVTPRFHRCRQIPAAPMSFLRKLTARPTMRRIQNVTAFFPLPPFWNRKNQISTWVSPRFNNRVVQNNKNCWSQDVIEEPLVGLTASGPGGCHQQFFTERQPVPFSRRSGPRTNDYLPDLDNGGAGHDGFAIHAIAMQWLRNPAAAILALQTWSVDFKLCAPSKPPLSDSSLPMEPSLNWR